jgi:basic amino acid/polyamine antiporter, APA family
MAFLLGTLSLLSIYVAANVGYVAALGVTGVAASTRTAASALGAVVSHGAARIVTLVILVSIFSAANSIMLNSPRVYYAMAKDGLFFHSMARVHPRFGTPAVAIAMAGAWSTLLALSGTFEQLLTYVVFIGWIFYALAAASIFIYRRRFPGLARPFRVPAYPLTPILFVAVAMGLVASTIATQPRRAAIGLGIMFLGAPAYAFWRRGAFRKASAGPL